MGTTQRLIKRLKDCGVNTDEVIYSLCVGDIVECVAEVYGEEVLNLTDEELKEIVDMGVKSTEHIDWCSPIEYSLEKPIHEIKNLR